LLCACSGERAQPSQPGGTSAPRTAAAASGAAASQPTAAGGSAPDVALLPSAPAAAAPSPAAQACARAELKIERVVPTVWLMIDGSGSMGAPLDLDLTGPSRWSLLRDVLLADNTGLVPRLQSSVAFGLYVYDGGLSLPGVPGPQCPRVVTADPALNNAAAVSSAYPELEIGASTPTHYALLDLKMRIDAAAPRPGAPTYVVLATDGKPNLCDFHDGLPATPDTEQEAVDTVRQLAAAGTQVFVISMAGSDPELQAHLEAVAAAGNTGKPPFTPTSQSELAAALTQILGATASCEVRIQGRVEAGRECSGTVMLNGSALGCNDANGYRLKEDRASLELLGSACTSLQTASAPELRAAFPCDDVKLF
jgi:Mg-chelatase subunit ChlD